MSGDAARAALAAVVRSALGASAGARVARVMHAPTVTALVADAADADALALVLPPVLDALARAGVPRGRAFVLLAAPRDGGAVERATRVLRDAVGVPVIAHHPDRSACFTLGRTPGGTLVELNDELREAEAVVVLASVTAADAADRATRLVLPALASAASARAHAALAEEVRARDARDASGLLGLDFGVAWCEGRLPRAWAGEAQGAFEAASSALAVLDPPRGRT